MISLEKKGFDKIKPADEGKFTYWLLNLLLYVIIQSEAKKIYIIDRRNKNMRNEIILIGPMGVGKSHIANLLSERIEKPRVWFDALRWDYYNEIGYDRQIELKFREENKLLGGLYSYWKPFELHAVKRILNQFSDCIFDFGAGYSVYDDYFMFEEAKEILSDFKNIIFLLPSKNQDESLEFLKRRLNERKGGELSIEDVLMLKYFMNHRSNYELCTHIIYVKDRHEDDIVKEIIDFKSI